MVLIRGHFREVDQKYLDVLQFYAEKLFSRKSCRLWDDVEKCGGAGEATADNTALALYVLDN